jgi:hypothetical protein
MVTRAWNSHAVRFDTFYGQPWEKAKAFGAPTAGPVSKRVVSRCHDSGDSFAFLAFEPASFHHPLNQWLVNQGLETPKIPRFLD